MTAPTLPAMTDIECEDLIGWADGRWHDSEYRIDARDLMNFVRHVASERDAQWAARHNAWVDGIDKAMAAEVDKLQSEIENLHSVMIAAAEEIHEHWQAHCDEDGYGPANLMHRLEKGIPAEYAYKSGDFERLAKERDAAVARLDAAVREARMAGVHSVHEQTAVIVRAALELLECVDGCDTFPPEKLSAFRRVFGE